MPERRTFFDYVANKCYNRLYAAAKEYLDENWQQLDDLYSRRVPDIAEVSLIDGTVVKVHLRDLPGMRVGFDVGFELQVAVYNKDRYRDLSDERNVWLRISCEGDLSCGLDDWCITGIAPYDKRQMPANALSEELVPIIRKEQLERRATAFLREYYPEALRNPMYLDPQVLVERMGLSIRTQAITKEGSVFGQIYFEDCKTEMYNPQADEMVPVTIPKKTIVVDPEVMLLRGLGSWGNTVVHEAVHWALHRKVFVFEHLTNTTATRINCEAVGAMKAETLKKSLEMMEYQANALAPRIQMPIGPFKTQAEKFIRKYQHEHPSLQYVDIIERVIGELAIFFHVSNQSAKIRMIEAGYEEAVGTYTYLDGRYVKPHSFKKGSLQWNQTFSISAQDAAVQCVTDSRLYSLTSHGGYQYVDSHFVLDRPRYLTYDTDGTMALTEYARTHMDECCLIFNMKMKAQNEVDNRYHRICYLNRGKGGYDFDLTFHGGYENAPQERQDAFLQQQLEEEARIADKMTGDPRVCAEILLKWRKTTYEKLAGEIGISDKTISRMFNRKVRPKQDTVFLTCIGLHLPPDISLHLFQILGVPLIITDTRQHWLKFALGTMYNKSVSEVRAFLLRQGVELRGVSEEES